MDGAEDANRGGPDGLSNSNTNVRGQALPFEVLDGADGVDARIRHSGEWKDAYDAGSPACSSRSAFSLIDATHRPADFVGIAETPFASDRSLSAVQSVHVSQANRHSISRDRAL